MSPRSKKNRPKKHRVTARSGNSRVVVSHSVMKTPPNYDKLARAVVELAKDIREAEAMGISVDELRKQRFRGGCG
jgi:hypothetical protein